MAPVVTPSSASHQAGAMVLIIELQNVFASCVA